MALDQPRSALPQPPVTTLSPGFRALANPGGTPPPLYTLSCIASSLSKPKVPPHENASHPLVRRRGQPSLVILCGDFIFFVHTLRFVLQRLGAFAPGVLFHPFSCVSPVVAGKKKEVSNGPLCYGTSTIFSFVFSAFGCFLMQYKVWHVHLG